MPGFFLALPFFLWCNISMTKQKQKLMIIDGNALIHRSFHALPPTMATKKGEMVNAVFGFTSVLLKAIREFQPGYVVLTLDKKGPTFRHKEFKEYKATRVKAPDDLYTQIPRVKEVAGVLNIPIFEQTGFEADDLIGTVVKKTDGQIEKIIVTGDLDTLQLIDDNIKVYTMSRGLSDSVIYDKQAVKDRYGLAPDQMIDYKALRGDPSDNIPGVRGIGEKTAVELLQNFKTLDGVYKNINSKKTKDRIRELLKEHKKEAYLSRDLATIKCDVKINFNLDKAKFGDFDKDKAVKLFSELEFKSLLPRINNLVEDKGLSKEEKQEKIADKFERNRKNFKYQLIDDDKKFNSFFKKLKTQKAFTFDTETSSFDPLDCDLLGISFSWEKGEAYFVKMSNVECRMIEMICLVIIKTQKHKNNLWLTKLEPIFEDEKVKKYAHNSKFDTRVMSAKGVKVRGLDFDTMIASYLLNPGTRQHNLDALTFSELGFEKISKDDLLGKGRDKISFPQAEDEKLMLYSCEDADFTQRLVKKLKPQLKEKKLDELFNKTEMPLVEVLARMEDEGIKIDTEILAKMSQKLGINLKKLEKNIYKEAKEEFNINSTQQLKAILFEKLQIPTGDIKKGKTGYSTAADELGKIKDLHSIVPLLQEYRELTKLLSTYIKALPEMINKKTKRLHTSFNQTITATGRLSSSEPNLQNIPIRTELGREIRKAFIAEKGYKLLSLDYSQIELRLAAHMSGDKKMIKAFKDGEDIHTSTAAEINGVSPKDVTSQMRREAKATNFGILYGQGPHGLAQTADIPYFKAKEFIEKYFASFPDIKKYIDKTIKFAQENGYVETLFARRRYLPEINSSVIMVRKGAERMAINMPLQGTSADMIKVAMVQIANLSRELSSGYPELSSERKDYKMLLQVHDELLFEVKAGQEKETAKKIKKIMEEVIKLKVPVEVDVKAGDNWGELKELVIS